MDNADTQHISQENESLEALRARIRTAQGQMDAFLTRRPPVAPIQPVATNLPDPVSQTEEFSSALAAKLTEAQQRAAEQAVQNVQVMQAMQAAHAERADAMYAYLREAYPDVAALPDAVRGAYLRLAGGQPGGDPVAVVDAVAKEVRTEMARAGIKPTRNYRTTTLPAYDTISPVGASVSDEQPVTLVEQLKERRKAAGLI